MPQTGEESMSNIMLGGWARMPGKDRKLRRRLNNQPPMSVAKKAILLYIFILCTIAVIVWLFSSLSNLIPPKPM